MAAGGGRRLITNFASIVVAVALAGGLAGCEYSPGDVPAADGAAGRPSAFATGSDEANTDAVKELLGAPDTKGLPYQTGPTAMLSSEIETGQYLLTAGCVGASGADVSVTLGDSPPERYSFSCGMGKVIHIDHRSGQILAEVVPHQPRPGAVTGLKLEHHPAPRDMETRRQIWMTEQLGQEKPGEFRRFLSGEGVATGPLAGAGSYDLALVCSGPDSVDLTVLSASGEPILETADVPCGDIFRMTLPLETEGAMMLVDSGGSPSRTALSIIRAEAAR
jgi:hypothetical protein